ncbi:hypothetical protein N9772_05245 [Bacteroidia bacterium]|nr:hypothetical protein [Bacteroidia bacterium]
MMALNYVHKHILFGGALAYRDAKRINKNTDTLNDLGVYPFSVLR